MRRIFALPMCMTLGFLPVALGTSAANATVAAPALSTLEKQAQVPGQIIKVWGYGGYGGCHHCGHRYHGGYGGYGYRGYGYGYGHRRHYYGGGGCD